MHSAITKTAKKLPNNFTLHTSHHTFVYLFVGQRNEEALYDLATGIG